VALAAAAAGYKGDAAHGLGEVVAIDDDILLALELATDDIRAY
jgi:hypothetical protein